VELQSRDEGVIVYKESLPVRVDRRRRAGRDGWVGRSVADGHCGSLGQRGSYVWLALHTRFIKAPEFGNLSQRARLVTEDSHYFSWEEMMRIPSFWATKTTFPLVFTL
jgi:hypothetical protein